MSAWMNISSTTDRDFDAFVLIDDECHRVGSYFSQRLHEKGFEAFSADANDVRTFLPELLKLTDIEIMSAAL